MSFPLAQRLKCAGVFWLAPLAIGIAIEEPPPVPIVYTVFDKGAANEAPIGFDWNGLDTRARPIAVNHAAFKFVPENPDVPALWTRIDGPVAAGTNEYAAARVLEGIGPGRYRLRVQLLSTEGLWSSFSNDFWVEVIDSSQAAAPPSAPSGLRKMSGGAP